MIIMLIFTCRRWNGRQLAILVVAASIGLVAWSGWKRHNEQMNRMKRLKDFDPTLVRFVEAPKLPGVGATQSPWQDAVSDPRPVVLATTNKAFLDFTENWLESIKRVGTKPRILVVAEDEETQRFLYGRPDVHVVISEGFKIPAHKLEWDSPIYNAMVNKRPAYIYQLLEKGHHVLFSDVDTVWLKEPFQFLDGEFDIAVEEDQHKPYIAYCAGFVYFRCTEKTKEFVKEWLRRLHESQTSISDQVIMNKMLIEEKLPGLRKKVMSSQIFPNGKLYFANSQFYENHHEKAAVVHNNWVQSKEVKLQRFKANNLWFVEDREG
ncbi:UDP-D-xylose:L-fucose alpha-1,3-D-xylosyltransferase 3-like isoform X2 [Asterias rubens]|uniref:UDP-D-xylose:L-fucose alpha-1,3-D-xylosyltransferase 3-like isoform X2 n=1 Tax=Asterias rubens TaxID=7604 RepID=UPI0014551EAA|nr:UDP-D-xylose:L-fucose alpha-1,3-D-xylosyltransferase 3-like isoform X2 [Asterias rubens]